MSVSSRYRKCTTMCFEKEKSTGVNVSSTVRRLLMATLLSAISFAATFIWYYQTRPKQSSDEDQEPIAYVVKVVDEISRRPATRELWQSVNTGETLFNGEAIRTSEKGEVRLQFADSERYLDLEPDSLIVLQKSKQEISLDLMEGSLFVSNDEKNNEKSQANKSLTLKSGSSKIDLTQASAKLSGSSSGAIEVNVLKGAAKVKSAKGEEKRIESGKHENIVTEAKQEIQDIELLSPDTSKTIRLHPKQDSLLKISWSQLKKPSGKIKYELLVGETRKKLDSVLQASDSFADYKFSSGKHFFKIQARNEKKEIVGASVVHLIDIENLKASEPILPIQDELVQLQTDHDPVHMKWELAPQAQSVGLEVSSTLDFKDRLLAKNFGVKDETSWLVEKDKLRSGDYYWRTVTYYTGVADPVVSEIHHFKLKEKESVRLVMNWNKDMLYRQRYPNQLKLALHWQITDQLKKLKQIASYKVLYKLKDEKTEFAENKFVKNPDDFKRQIASENSAATTQTATHETSQTISQSLNEVQEMSVQVPGVYSVQIKAQDADQKEIGETVIADVDVEQIPRLMAPKIESDSGQWVASADGDFGVHWNALEGAKEYDLVWSDSSGKEIAREHFSKNQTRSVKKSLMPGSYGVQLYIKDEFNREGLTNEMRKFDVPQESQIVAPKLKKVKVN